MSSYSVLVCRFHFKETECNKSNQAISTESGVSKRMQGYSVVGGVSVIITDYHRGWIVSQVVQSLGIKHGMSVKWSRCLAWRVGSVDTGHRGSCVSKMVQTISIEGVLSIK